MIEYVLSMFGWLPTVMQVVVYGVIALFIIWSVLKIVQLVMDLIPFL